MTEVAQLSRGSCKTWSPSKVRTPLEDKFVAFCVFCVFCLLPNLSRALLMHDVGPKTAPMQVKTNTSTSTVVQWSQTSFDSQPPLSGCLLGQLPCLA